MLETLKELVLSTAKKAVSIGLVHEKAGNFSLLDPSSQLVVITPSGIPREKLSASDMCVVDLDGNLVEGKYKPSSETPMHTCIFREIPGIFAVVHTHSIFATSFAVAGKSIPAATNEMAKFNGEIPVVPFQIPGSPELGTTAIPYLKKHNCCLLANHGLLTVGKDLDDALLNAIAAEDIAKIVVVSTILGGPKLITDEMFASIREYKNNIVI